MVAHLLPMSAQDTEDREKIKQICFENKIKISKLITTFVGKFLSDEAFRKELITLAQTE